MRTLVCPMGEMFQHKNAEEMLGGHSNINYSYLSINLHRDRCVVAIAKAWKQLWEILLWRNILRHRQTVLLYSPASTSFSWSSVLQQYACLFLCVLAFRWHLNCRFQLRKRKSFSDVMKAMIFSNVGCAHQAVRPIVAKIMSSLAMRASQIGTFLLLRQSRHEPFSSTL